MKRALFVFGAAIATFAFTNTVSFRLGRRRGLDRGHAQMVELYARRASASSACVDLTEPAAITRTGAGNASPPAAHGGPLTDGVFVMTDERVYGTREGFGIGTSASAVRITGTTFERINHDKVLYNDVVTVERGNVEVSGTKLVVHVTCPAPAHDVAYDFTSDGAHLVLQMDERAGDTHYPAVKTFTR